MELETTWKQWRHLLGQAVGLGRLAGLSDDTISRAAAWLGEFLAREMDPANPQQQVLRQLWDHASDEERRTLARIMVRLVSEEERSQGKGEEGREEARPQH